jgi:hypothetical protein
MMTIREESFDACPGQTEGRSLRPSSTDAQWRATVTEHPMIGGAQAVAQEQEK